jgi:hypothetical protein
VPIPLDAVTDSIRNALPVEMFDQGEGHVHSGRDA